MEIKEVSSANISLQKDGMNMRIRNASRNMDEYRYRMNNFHPRRPRRNPLKDQGLKSMIRNRKSMCMNIIFNGEMGRGALGSQE